MLWPTLLELMKNWRPGSRDCAQTAAHTTSSPATAPAHNQFRLRKSTHTVSTRPLLGLSSHEVCFSCTHELSTPLAHTPLFHLLIATAPSNTGLGFCLPKFSRMLTELRRVPKDVTEPRQSIAVELRRLLPLDESISRWEVQFEFGRGSDWPTEMRWQEDGDLLQSVELYER